MDELSIFCFKTLEQFLLGTSSNKRARLARLAEESLSFTETYMGPRGHSLESALHQYEGEWATYDEMLEVGFGRVYLWFAKAVKRAGSNVFAQIWIDAQNLQTMIDTLPGETDTPEYEAWVEAVEDLEARFFDAGGLAAYRKVILNFTVSNPAERQHLLQQYKSNDEEHLRQWRLGPGRIRQGLSVVFDVGERVFHQKHGYGEIRSIDTHGVWIAFEKSAIFKIAPNFIVSAKDAPHHQN